MRHSRFRQGLFFCLACLLCLCAAAAAEDAGLGVFTRQCTEMPGEAGAVPVPMQCGPTEQFLPAGTEIDLSAPYVFFGQADCWAMVAPGSAGGYGAVGWVPSAAAAFPDGPELLFEDAVPVTVMEDTFLTLEPLAETPAQLCEVKEGAQPVVLAVCGGWAYVQTETGGAPVRAFLPLSSFL